MLHSPVSFCRTLYVYNLVNRCNAIPACVEIAFHSRDMWLGRARRAACVSGLWWSSFWSNAGPPIGLKTHYDTWDEQSTMNAFRRSRGVLLDTSISGILAVSYHSFLEIASLIWICNHIKIIATIGCTISTINSWRFM